MATTYENVKEARTAALTLYRDLTTRQRMFQMHSAIAAPDATWSAMYMAKYNSRFEKLGGNLLAIRDTVAEEVLVLRRKGEHSV